MEKFRVFNTSNKPISTKEVHGVKYNACYYCGDMSKPAAYLRDRKIVVCLDCIDKGIGKDDPKFKK